MHRSGPGVGISSACPCLIDSIDWRAGRGAQFVVITAHFGIYWASEPIGRRSGALQLENENQDLRDGDIDDPSGQALDDET